jgi:hypothetical protein
MATLNGNTAAPDVGVADAAPKTSKFAGSLHRPTPVFEHMTDNQGTQETAGVSVSFEESPSQRSWQQHVSHLCVKILWHCYGILKVVGFLVEWTLNLFSLNDGVFGLLYRLCFLQWGRIQIPNSEADNYYSCVGQLDPRLNLIVDTSKEGKAHSTEATAEIFPNETIGARSTANVCIMAAKLAYENEAVLKKVVTQNWNMHFVGFWNCWNEYQKMRNTQVFVFMDKPKDANAVVVAWRGTEAFNAYDWSTDIDFEWVKFSNGMGIHMGFLEALGLGTRENKESFLKMGNNAEQKNQNMAKQERKEADAAYVPGSPRVPPSPHHKSMEEIKQTPQTSGLPDEIIADPNKMLAYDDITKIVGKLLLENPEAKVFITGHSLGGALAALYSTMLYWNGENEMTSKIAAVYTFGQPRVGDQDFALYATRQLRHKYYRVVYCNDVVPRVPFDNEVFSFKHFGNCAYFNSVYDGMVLQEAPDRNFFSLTGFVLMPLNAMWELFQSLVILSSKHGTEYRESSASILFRLLGLVLPGVASHSPCNYVNSVRLGPFPLGERLKGDIADLAEEVRLVNENIKDIFNVILSGLPAVPGKDIWKFALEKLLAALK